MRRRKRIVRGGGWWGGCVVVEVGGLMLKACVGVKSKLIESERQTSIRASRENSSQETTSKVRVQKQGRGQKRGRRQASAF